jgi:hypothetical protein
MKSRSYHKQKFLNIQTALLLFSAAVAIGWVGDSHKSHFLCGVSFLVISVFPAFVVVGALKTRVANISSSTAHRDQNPFTFWLFVAMTGALHLLMLGVGFAFFLHIATPTDW